MFLRDSEVYSVILVKAKCIKFSSQGLHPDHQFAISVISKQSNGQNECTEIVSKSISELRHCHKQYFHSPLRSYILYKLTTKNLLSSACLLEKLFILSCSCSFGCKLFHPLCCFLCYFYISYKLDTFYKFWHSPDFDGRYTRCWPFNWTISQTKLSSARISFVKFSCMKNKIVLVSSFWGQGLFITTIFQVKEILGSAYLCI